MPRKRVLITVTTYPLPSRSYADLVCTAGITERGEWIRIYPIPLSFLSSLKKDGSMIRTKYTWLELDLRKRRDDFRPESYSPRHYDFRDLVIGDSIDTQNNWKERKDYCLKNVFSNMENLLNQSASPTNLSLAIFKPLKIISFYHKEDDREWKQTFKAASKQEDLFPDENRSRVNNTTIRKPPYKFYYCFQDDNKKISNFMIEDWEISQLYWNCLKRANGNEFVALEKVYQKYENDFIENKEIYFYMGTRLYHHIRRFTNPFGIMGVFYPKKE